MTKEPVPVFQSEDEERAFWESHSSVNFFPDDGVERLEPTDAALARRTAGRAARADGLTDVPKAPARDTQVVELLGRNRLVSELLAAGLEVAVPLRDHGIDVVAYLDLDASVGRFVARPIQMKAAWKRSFSIYRKYEKFPDLILAYVWHLEDIQGAVTYAMTYPQAAHIAETLGWTQTPSWQSGWYSTSQPGARVLELLKQHRMDAGRWKGLISDTAKFREL